MSFAYFKKREGTWSSTSLMVEKYFLSIFKPGNKPRNAPLLCQPTVGGRFPGTLSPQ